MVFVSQQILQKGNQKGVSGAPAVDSMAHGALTVAGIWCAGARKDCAD